MAIISLHDWNGFLLVDVLDNVLHIVQLILDGDHSKLIGLEFAAKDLEHLKLLLDGCDLLLLLEINAHAWNELLDLSEFSAQLLVTVEVPLNLFRELLRLSLDLLHAFLVLL